MRFSYLLSFSVLLLASGCATQSIMNGTASYTSSPSSPATSGAVPASSILCVNRAHPHEGKFSAGVRFGDDCVLAGTAIGNGMPLQAVGECALPTAAGPLPLEVETATLDIQMRSATVTVGGKTRDGRYVDFRYVGMRIEEISGKACDPVFEGTAIPKKEAALETP